MAAKKCSPIQSPKKKTGQACLFWEGQVLDLPRGGNYLPMTAFKSALASAFTAVVSVLAMALSAAA
jgi:hypothetical protein